MNLFNHQSAMAAVLLLSCGCYHPYPNQGWQGQPGYYPAPPGQLQAPGQLYIPPSNAPLAAPGTPARGYEDEDDFGRDDGSYFGEDGGVPAPRGSGGSGLDSDFP